MDNKQLYWMIAIVIAVFIALFAGYRLGADVAQTHNRSDAAVNQEAAQPEG